MANKASPSLMGCTSEAIALLLRMTYTGLDHVIINSGPVVAWTFDMSDPENMIAIPVAITRLPPAPPDTAPVISPRWAISYPQSGGMVWTVDYVFAGSFPDFLTWLATNNGAKRTLEADLATPSLANMWNDWQQSHQ